MKILLMGNPNVGKSIVFSRLTGTNVTSSNYSGTTVEFKKGKIKLNGDKADLIDVPGTYTLDATNDAERVATEMLKSGDIVVNVVDATNLERNLNLTLQLLEQGIPMVVALNLYEEAKHKGIDINSRKLEKLLGVPVVPAEALSGRGMRRLRMRLEEAATVNKTPSESQERWQEIGTIIDQVQNIYPKEHTLLETLEDMSISPFTGAVIALIVVTASFFVVRFIGESLITYICNPFFEQIYAPLMLELSTAMGGSGILHDLLLGKSAAEGINFGTSFGLLTTGVYIPLAAVLPYIFSYYLVLGFLEDIGYLPRLAVLADNVMHQVGLHGYGLVPMILGLGCNVPAALAVRSLGSKREKFIASTLMALAVPCMAQIAMIIGLVGAYGLQYIAYIFAILVILWLLLGLILNRFVSGFSPELVLEVPPYRVTRLSILLKKLWMRILSFLKEAIPLVFLGVLVVNMLYVFGVIDILSNALGPFLRIVFGLPEEAVSALLIGFLRKDVAMGMLVPLNLSLKQLLISSVVLTIYFPCAATFFVLIKELGVKGMFKSLSIMLLTAVIVGGFLNLSFSGTSFEMEYVIGALAFVAGVFFLNRIAARQSF